VSGGATVSGRLVWGQNPVRELVAARGKVITVVYLAEGDTGPALKQLRDQCRARGVSVEDRTRGELDALCGAEARHQGAVAVAGEFVYAELEDVLDGLAGRARPPLLMVLDGVQDPHNFGAIARSSLVFGADAVVVPKDRAAPVTPVVVKASAGATEHLPIARVTNLSRALEQMKEAGLWSVAAVSATDAPPPWKVDLRGPIALVMGTEGKGLRPLVERTCDLRARIPMLGQVASLNVSVAAGILLAETLRQRAPA
jgi:23S rRNA (guanosine2251-2'-O)-methyltransferase